MKKRDIILALILVVLVVAYFLLRNRNPMERPQSIFSTDSLRIGSIEVLAGGEALTLQKIDHEWRIVDPVNWKADEDRMRSFFIDVISAKVPGTVMSTGESAIVRYRVDEANGTQVKVYDTNGKLRDHVIFGNAGAPHDYFRYADENKIYQIKQKVAYHYEPTLGYWRDPRVLKIDHNDIARINVKYYDNTYVITRDEKGWRYTDAQNDFIIDRDNRQMIRMINILYLLETRVFFDGDNSADALAMKTPHCEVIVHLKDGNSRKLTFIRDRANFKLMLDDDISTLYGVLGDTLDRFTRSVLVFREVYDLP